MNENERKRKEMEELKRKSNKARSDNKQGIKSAQDKLL